MPVSAHCKDLLEKTVDKDACLDFRDTRARVMCQAWHIMDEEKVPFKEAVRSSWDRSKKDCAVVGMFSPEPVDPRLSVDIVDAETGQRKGVISLMEDGHVSVCAEKAPCYMTEKPSPEIYYIAQAYYSGIGYGVKPHEES